MIPTLQKLSVYLLLAASGAVSLFDLSIKISGIGWMTYRRILPISQLKQGRA